MSLSQEHGRLHGSWLMTTPTSLNEAQLVCQFVFLLKIAIYYLPSPSPTPPPCTVSRVRSFCYPQSQQMLTFPHAIFFGLICLSVNGVLLNNIHTHEHMHIHSPSLTSWCTTFVVHAIYLFPYLSVWMFPVLCMAVASVFPVYFFKQLCKEGRKSFYSKSAWITGRGERGTQVFSLVFAMFLPNRTQSPLS